MSEQLMNLWPHGPRIHDGLDEYRCRWTDTDEVGISTGAHLPGLFLLAVRQDIIVWLRNFVKKQIDWFEHA